MKVNVTQKDIENGMANICFLCPVALALNRGLGEGYNIFVTPRFINIFTENGTDSICSVTLPMEATDFINDFDYGAPVKPFSFEI